MKSLLQYILEDDEDKDSKSKQEELKAKIKFTIWEEPDKKVLELKNNESYQKIEYKYEDKENNIYIDFLLGFKDNSWKLWAGKIGSCSYDDDPYCSFETTDFKDSIIQSLDKIIEIIEDVKNDPMNYVQYYKNM